MPMFNDFYDFINISPLRDYCMRHGNVVSYNKGEYYLQEGNVGRQMGIVLSGYFKYVVTDSKGVDVVVGFAFEGEPVVDYANSLVSPCPSIFSIMAGSKGSVLEVSIAGLRKFIWGEFPEFFHETSPVLFSEAYRRYLDIYRKTPVERYLELLNKHPDMVNTITAKDLASYLKITPVYLCRIRKNLGR